MFRSGDITLPYQPFIEGLVAHLVEEQSPVPVIEPLDRLTIEGLVAGLVEEQSPIPVIEPLGHSLVQQQKVQRGGVVQENRIAARLEQHEHARPHPHRTRNATQSKWNLCARMGVYTLRKQHQRVCVQICARASCVDEA